MLANPYNPTDPEQLAGDIIENIGVGLRSCREIALTLDASTSQGCSLRNTPYWRPQFRCIKKRIFSLEFSGVISTVPSTGIGGRLIPLHYIFKIWRD